jgi:transposase
VPKPFRDSDREGPPESERKPRAFGSNEATVETVAKRSRRVFSAADKLRIVKEADRCLASGKRGAVGALLRQEGIYASLLSSWRTQLGAQGAGGLAPKRPGRKPKFNEIERRVVQLEKRNAVLERKLHVASVLIGLQKKAHEILGLALPESDEDS